MFGCRSSDCTQKRWEMFGLYGMARTVCLSAAPALSGAGLGNSGIVWVGRDFKFHPVLPLMGRDTFLYLRPCSVCPWTLPGMGLVPGHGSLCICSRGSLCLWLGRSSWNKAEPKGDSGFLCPARSHRILCQSEHYKNTQLQPLAFFLPLLDVF